MSRPASSTPRDRVCVAWTAGLPQFYNSRATSEEFTFRNARCRLQFDYFNKCKFRLVSDQSHVTGPFVVTVFVARGGEGLACRELASERVPGPPWECSFKDDPRHQYSYHIRNVGMQLRIRFVVLFENDPTTPVASGNAEQQNGTGTKSIKVACKESDFPSNLDSLSLDFASLLKSETLPDVKLKCGGRCSAIPAHRAVLAARSEVFAAMFRNKMAESRSGEVDVPDVEDDVIDLFLQYVYSGRIPSGVSDEVVPGLYVAADKYAVHALRETCREQMVTGLTQKNCVHYLTLADAHGDAMFKKSVMEYICSHEAVFKRDAWREFAKKPSSLAMEVYQNFVERKTGGIRLDDILAHRPLSQPNEQDCLMDQYPII